MSDEKRSWEAFAREARAVETAPAGEPVTPALMMRAALARRLESAHESAVREAEQLVEDAARLVRRLKEDGLGAIVSGNGFLGRAQATQEALLGLESARDVCRMAVKLQKAHEEGERREG
jgi:hypothetical protein